MLKLSKNNWTQGASARDKSGRIVHRTSPAAVKFDLSSAVRNAAFTYDHYWAEMLRLKLVIRKLFRVETPVWVFNDKAKWEDIQKVLEIFD